MSATFTVQDSQTVAVRVGGKLIGKILESRKGFRFYPKDTSLSGGEFYSTLQACKDSLNG